MTNFINQLELMQKAAEDQDLSTACPSSLIRQFESFVVSCIDLCGRQLQVGGKFQFLRSFKMFRSCTLFEILTVKRIALS
jgi:hypothetical protein